MHIALNTAIRLQVSSFSQTMVVEFGKVMLKTSDDGIFGLLSQTVMISFILSCSKDDGDEPLPIPQHSAKTAGPKAWGDVHLSSTPRPGASSPIQFQARPAFVSKPTTETQTAHHEAIPPTLRLRGPRNSSHGPRIRRRCYLYLPSHRAHSTSLHSTHLVFLPAGPPRRTKLPPLFFHQPLLRGGYASSLRPEL